MSHSNGVESWYCFSRDSGEDPIVVILSFRSKFYNASVTYSIGKLRKLNLKVNRFINELNLKLYISLIITKNYIALVLNTIYNKSTVLLFLVTI